MCGFVIFSGESFAVGTLDKDKFPQFSLDVTITSEEIKISHTGDSDVHITGYRAIAANSDDLDDYADLLEDGML